MTDDLMLALLALDSYNRGPDAKLKIKDQNRIGAAELISLPLPTDAPSVAFYATAYKWNGKYVISYRGTDLDRFSDEISNGYGVGAGFAHGPQATDAIKFFQQVATISNPSIGDDWKSANIVVTGHSLGGGLAGFVGSIYGKTGTIFDNMTFTDAAAAALNDTSALYFDPSTGRPLPDGNGNSLLLYPGWSSFLYGSSNPYPNDPSKLSAFATTGEVLDGLVARIGQTPTVTHLDSNAGTPSNIINLHSMSLLAILIYARDNQRIMWSPIGSSLYSAYFNDDIGRAVGLARGITGGGSPAGQMLAEIAYSALDPGTPAPFGTTAIRSMFNDADLLGSLIAQGRFSGRIGTKSVRDAISEILVQFAGDQSTWAGKNSPQLAEGLRNVDPNSIQSLSALDGALRIDLDPRKWAATFSTSGTGKIVGVNDFLTSILTSAAGAGGVLSRMKASTSVTSSVLSGSTETEILASLADNATLDASALGRAPAKLKSGAPGGAIIVGGKHGNTVRGSTGSDLIVLDGGTNTVTLTAGTDVILGGSGTNVLQLDATLFNGLAAGADGGTTYYVSSPKDDKGLIGAAMRGTFEVDLRNQYPFGVQGGKSWDKYETTLNGHTFRAYIDPVDDYTIDLPENARSNTSAATDEFDDGSAPAIHIQIADHFTTATLEGDWALDRAVKTSTIDAGAPDDGYGNKLDASSYTRAKSLMLAREDGTRTAFEGVFVNHNVLVGSGVTLNNFQILYGTDAGDVVVGKTDFKNIYLGDGDNLVQNLSGGVIDGQAGDDRNWVFLHLGDGNSTVEGGLAAGSEIFIEGATHADRIDIAPDIAIHGLGASDRLLSGTTILHGGMRNLGVVSGENAQKPQGKDAWFYGPKGVRYAVNGAGQLVVQLVNDGVRNMVRGADGAAPIDASTYVNGVTADITLTERFVWSGGLLHRPAWVGSVWQTWDNAVAQLNEHAKRAASHDPLVLDLSGNGLALTDLSRTGPRFDVTGDGFAVPSGWFGATQGVLVKLDANGRVTGGAQFVGAVSGALGRSDNLTKGDSHEAANQIQRWFSG